MKLLFLIILFPSLLFAKTIKVAVIDTGLDKLKGVKLCPNGNIDLTETNTHSERGQHGNNIVHIISDNLDNVDYCIYSIKVITNNETLKSKFNQGIALAIEKNVDIINYSAGGPESEIWEEAIVYLAVKKGIKFIVAAGNNGHDLDKKCDFFPACYKFPGMTIVGNKHKSSNYGKNTVNVVRKAVNINAGNVVMTGTSQSCALETRRQLLDMIKNVK